MRYLYLVIEPNIKHNEFTNFVNDDELKVIDYEDELRTCIMRWRNKFNHLKDISIIVVNPTENDIKEETLNICFEYNVTYIHKRFENIKNKYNEDNRWDIIAVIGEWLENEYLEQEDIIIHIDLDMFMIKDIHKDLLDLNDDELAIVAGCDIIMYDRPEEFKKKQYTLLGVTCFMVSKVKNGFYSKWKDKIIDIYESGVCDSSRI